ncbi:hypothetical protein SYNPS1DRAFT_23997, partial [Syncephalis pseudoplumigaleata]
MPCILKVKVLAARDLPVMDRKSELTDAYVEVRYAEFESQRTDIARKTLAPVWNEDFRYEVSDDSDLQDEPLELRVLDYDAITANDELAGWFPIYDTLRGMRGELHIQVRLQFFGDANPFNDSSAGVAFLSGTQLPPLGRSSAVTLGFVDAFESERDPEYHWSDSFRTPRASNEARQRLLFRLSGRLRRALGVKVLDLGGNAVTGYRHWFDIEQEEGVITARAVGCAVRLGLEAASSAPVSLEHRHSYSRAISSAMGTASDATPGHHAHRPSTAAPTSGKGGAILVCQSPTSPVAPTRPRLHHRRANSIMSDHPSLAPYAFRTTDQELFAIDTFPPGAIVRLGGLVTARSVKLIDSGNLTIRETWWSELREEIREHARALGCSSVIGYTETTAIHDDLCVLSVAGTAAVIDLGLGRMAGNVLTGPLSPSLTGCRMLHLPYHRSESPFTMNYVKCGCCRKRFVPEILLTTVERPLELDLVGEGCFVQAQLCRAKKRKEGESNAAIISEAIPFIEYDIHRQLVYKLRIQGMNAIFGIRIQLAIGDSLIVAVATGMAYYLTALPTPPALRIARNLEVLDEEDRNEDELDAEARRRHAVVHIDDDTDEDLLAVLLDPEFGDHFRLSCELARPPTQRPHQMVQLVHVVKQSAITSMDHHPNRQFSNIIRQLYEELRVRLQMLEPCLLSGIQLIVQLPRAYEVQVQLIASVLQPIDVPALHRAPSFHAEPIDPPPPPPPMSHALHVSRDEEGHVVWPASHAKAVDPWTLLPDDETCAAEELA